MSPLCDGEEGFTLVEILIAITLTCLIAVAMGTSLRLGLRSWERARTIAESAERLSATRGALGRLIETARPEYTSPNPLDLSVYFDGDADRASVIAPLPESIGHDILARQSIHLDYLPSQKKRILVLDWTLDLPTADGSDPTLSRIVLLEGVSSLKIRYWGQLGEDMATQWHSSWSSTDHLPDIVHIEVGLDGELPLVLDQRILATVSSSCIYDSINLNCSRR